jgi:DNA-directed RNA polymerase subunit L
MKEHSRTMVTVSNIKSSKRGVVLPEWASDLAELLPQAVPEFLSFELTSSNEAFANSLRRVFSDELEVRAMDMFLSDMRTNDKRLSDLFIQSRLLLVPLNQDTQVISDSARFSLYMENTTSAPIICRMSDFKITDNQETDISKAFDGNIQLCSLYPGCFLSIKNVGMKREQGFKNESYTIGPFRYKVLDADFSKSSVAQDNTAFRIEFQTNGQIGLKQLVNQIASTIRLRWTNVKVLLMAYIIQQSDQPSEIASRFSPKVFVVHNTKALQTHMSSGQSTQDGLWEIYIDEEYHTLGNVLMHYCLKVEPSLSIASYKLEHVLTNSIVFSINHKDYKKIVAKAIDLYLEDLDTWQMACIQTL